MKAIVTKEQGRIESGEYFAINILGVEVAEEYKQYYPEGKNICLRLSCSDYDWVEDPEKLICEIVKKINN